ncbi:MAG: sulfotransferase [Rhodocyclaceae bacterium]|nr:sulfotransferase [Rhodocyclaceae bacterium]
MLEIHGSKPLRVVVVSIGRSGTSLFARILDEVLGVEFGDETDHIPRNHNNPDGYFENAEFLAFNDRVLQAAGGWVLDPPALDYAARMDGNQRQELVAEAGHLLNRYAAVKPTFGWKDPRLSFTLPIWRAACPEIVPIIAFRKPYSVLSSIGAQLDRPIESLAGLWFRYYQHVFTHTEGLPRYFASFDQLLTDPASVVRGMAQHLGREIDESVVAKQLAEIVKPQQSRHSSAQNASNRPPIMDLATMDLYEYLSESVEHAGGQPDPQRLRQLLRL